MDQYLGQIQLFPYTYAPIGWTMCVGQKLPIAQNTALYSLFGNTYGGDGVSTFALPDLRNAAPYRFPKTWKEPTCVYCICTDGCYPPRS